MMIFGTMMKKQFKILKKEKKNPCNECLIKPICKKHFIDKTACEDFWQYVKEQANKRRLTY